MTTVIERFLSGMERRLWLAALCLLPAFAAHGELADTVAKVKPSIVIVGTFSKLRSPAFILRGTGFAIGDGSLIATNAHVLPTAPVTDTPEVLVVLVSEGGQRRPREARLLATNADHDMALLQMSGPALPPLGLGASDQVREGQAVAFTGFPIGSALGFSPVTHRGIISSITPITLPGGNARQLKESSVQRLRSGAFTIFQLDATAYPGNSGGPLFDIETGEVVGILSMGLIKTTKEAILEKPSGISYAIPSRYLQELLAGIKR